MKRVAAIKSRARFCQLAMTDKTKAADELRMMATGLENCRNTSDVVNALCQIFAIGERTVFNDLLQ